MLPRLCRLSSLLAAAALGGAVFGPPAHRGLCIDFALAFAAASLLLLLLARGLRERLQPRSAAIPPPLHLGAAALQEVGPLITAAVRAAGGFEGRLHRVGELLRAEIGAQRLRICLVEAAAEGAGAAPALGLVELLPAHPGFRVPRRDVRLDGAFLSRALTSGHGAMDLPHGLALPVHAGGRVVAVIELTAIVPDVNPVALEGLLELAAQALGASADRESLPPSAAPHAGWPSQRAALAPDEPRLHRVGPQWSAGGLHA